MARVADAVRELLEALGEDPDRSGLRRTPTRVAEVLADLTKAVSVDLATALGDPIELTDPTEAGDLIGITGIPFRALCEHHLLPFEGEVDVHYTPRVRLAGFGRIAALVELASSRPQVQEALGARIADTLLAVLQPYGVTVRITARHGCIGHVSARAADSTAVTVVARGVMPISPGN